MFLFSDVSLPALFMPFHRGTVFNPRAHQYFHPTGKSKLYFEYNNWPAHIVMMKNCLGFMLFATHRYIKHTISA